MFPPSVSAPVADKVKTDTVVNLKHFEEDKTIFCRHLLTDNSTCSLYFIVKGYIRCYNAEWQRIKCIVNVLPLQ